MNALKIALSKHRKDKTLKNTTVNWKRFCDKISSPQRDKETMEEFLQLPKDVQSEKKDVGGYVGGYLKEGCRKKGFVVSRSMLTLDMDDATPDTWKQVKAKLDVCSIAHSTRKHTPEHPRYRLIIPLVRDVSPQEYEAIARKLAEQLGMECFDPSTFQPERQMYWPSVCADSEFFFEHLDGPPLDPDEYLAMYDDWQDDATWPRHPKQPKAPRAATAACQKNTAHNPSSGQADPLDKPGIVGCFCRAYYPIDTAIEEFISDVYSPSSGATDRYDYIPAASAAGVAVYEDKYIYRSPCLRPALRPVAECL